jgi:hypothetical protein
MALLSNIACPIVVLMSQSSCLDTKGEPVMRRREFISLFGLAVFWPAGVQAQVDRQVRRVGVLSSDRVGSRVAGLRRGQRQKGAGRLTERNSYITREERKRARFKRRDFELIHHPVSYSRPRPSCKRKQTATRERSCFCSVGGLT